MRFMFRVDGNAHIGAGHVMRCMSVAAAADELGVECIFVMSDTSYVDLIAGKGFRFFVLNSEYNELEREITGLTSLICEVSPSLFFTGTSLITACSYRYHF